jgi:hypothetical protein
MFIKSNFSTLSINNYSNSGTSKAKSVIMVKDADIVGEAIAAVLPQYDRPFFKVPHLLKLNLILIVPLLSSAVAGYDGM